MSHPSPWAWRPRRQPFLAARCRWRDNSLRRIGVRNRYIGEIPIRKPGLRIMKPVIMQRLAVWIACARSVERDSLPNPGIHHNRSSAALPIHHNYGIVVRMRIIPNSPVHACGKVILESLAPAPDRCLVGDILATVSTHHRVLRSHAPEFVPALCPDRMRLAIWLPVDIAPAPSAPIGSAPWSQAVIDQVQERRRIALHNEHE